MLSVLAELRPGDIIGVPAGRHEGWAVVINPGTGRDRNQPSPLMMTEERQVKKLSATDFPTPPTVASRMRVPKHFDPRQKKDRRNLAAAFHSRLGTLDTAPERYPQAAMNADVAAEVSRLRDEFSEHPCHHCPDREQHARAAEKALQAERATADLQRQVDRRTRFDRVCTVLVALGYLASDGDSVTDAGRMLARIYSELDLVTAECIRAGTFDELDPAELAAVVSSLTYESRGGAQRAPVRMPNRSTEIAQTMVRRTWRDISLMERDQRLPAGRDPDIGFAEATYAWATGV
ncbi:MAG: RNA helicase, partial [Beutenbergiaceae bacterium]